MERLQERFSWPRTDTSGAADMEPAPDVVRPRGSVGTSKLDKEHGNAMNQPEVVKSGDAKSHPKQASPDLRQDRQTAPPSR
jgi:hypothetical protein